MPILQAGGAAAGYAWPEDKEHCEELWAPATTKDFKTLRADTVVRRPQGSPRGLDSWLLRNEGLRLGHGCMAAQCCCEAMHGKDSQIAQVRSHVECRSRKGLEQSEKAGS